MTEETASPKPIHARIELTTNEAGIDINIHALNDSENQAVILCRVISRNAGALMQMALAERAEAEQAHATGAASARAQSVIATATPRLLGPDGKMVS